MTTTLRHRSRSGPALAPGRARRGWAALLLTGIATLSGCYTHAPVTGAPAPGTTLVLDLNDRGRVALGDSIGSSAAQIRGDLENGSDSVYQLRVSAVQYLNGQTNQWAGEPLAVRTDFVSRAQARTFSRKRTWALGIGAVAAIVAFAASQDLLGSGSPPRDRPPPPPAGGS